MKKLIYLVIGLVVLFSSSVAFAYDINDLVGTGDDIKGKMFELYGIDFTYNSGNSYFDIYTDYTGALSVYNGATPWNTFAADLAIDADKNGTYEYGIALTSHDGLTAGTLYNVSDWYISNEYEVKGTQGQTLFNYNKNKIVTIKNGTAVTNSTGLVTWNQLDGSPKYRVNVPVNIASFFAPNYDGYANIFYATATCGNDTVTGRIPVAPEPISSALFLIGGGALAAIKMRRKK